MRRQVVFIEPPVNTNVLATVRGNAGYYAAPPDVGPNLSPFNRFVSNLSCRTIPALVNSSPGARSRTSGTSIKAFIPRKLIFRCIRAFRNDRRVAESTFLTKTSTGMISLMSELVVVYVLCHLNKQKKS